MYSKSHIKIYNKNYFIRMQIFTTLPVQILTNAIWASFIRNEMFSIDTCEHEYQF